MNREEAIKHELCPQWLKDADWWGEVELSDSWLYVTWEDGTWEGGIWKDGTWKYGIWKDGIWEGGFKSIGHCCWRVLYSDTHIKIGCKTKTVDEWGDWFASDEIYGHKRDSEQFKKIKQAYLMAVAAIEIEKETQ